MIVGANEVLVQAFEGARLKWSAPWTTELKKFLASTAPILFRSVWPKILAVLGRACVWVTGTRSPILFDPVE